MSAADEAWLREALPQRAPRKRHRRALEAPAAAASGGADASEEAATGPAARAPAERAAQAVPSAADGPLASDREASGRASGGPGSGADASPAVGARSAGARAGSGAVPPSTSTDAPLRSCAVEGYQFEYRDHTADIQIHSWGADLCEAFAQAALGMLNYATPLEGVAVDPSAPGRSFDVRAKDLDGLLFAFLDAVLYDFAVESFVCKDIAVLELVRPDASGAAAGPEGADRAAYALRAVGYGERFDPFRHEQGTEIKAITYSAMQIDEREGDADVFVIVDI